MDATLGSLAACVVTGLAGVLAAAFVTPHRHIDHGDSWIGFAVGALAGTALLEVVPEAWGDLGALQGVLLLMVAASASCFVLDRIFHCRPVAQGHDGRCYAGAESKAHSRGGSGRILLIGDFFHSVVDGSLIAAAFSTGPIFGLVVTGAMIAHEIPRKCATIMVLVHAGHSRGKALALGTLSSLGVLAGGIVAGVSLSSMHYAAPVLLWAAAGMIGYVVIVELLPILRSGGHKLMTFKQAGFVLLGLIVVSGTHLVL